MSEAVSLSMSLAAIAISAASVLLMRRTARTEARTQKLIEARKDPWQNVEPRQKP